MWGGELVLRDGVGTGQVTSAAYGTTTGACVGLAYVWRRDGDERHARLPGRRRVEINVGGVHRARTGQLGRPYDPTSERIRS